MNADEIQALFDEANKQKAELAKVDAQVTAEISPGSSATATLSNPHDDQSSDDASDLSDVQGTLDAQLNQAKPRVPQFQLGASSAYKAAYMGQGLMDDDAFDSVQSELSDVQSALGEFYTKLGDNDIEGRLKAIAKRTSKRTRLAMQVSLAASLMALAVAIYSNLTLNKNNATLTQANEQLVQRCQWNEARITLMSGQPASKERPLWYRHWNVLDLDREYLGQIHTLAGVVNVVRSRPTSVNNRTDLHFHVTNPMNIRVCGGKLILRTSPTQYNHTNDYDYESLRQFYGSLTQTEYVIGDLEPGQSRKVTIELPRIEDQPAPEYVDFEIVFDYFKPIDQSDAEPNAT